MSIKQALAVGASIAVWLLLDSALTPAHATKPGAGADPRVAQVRACFDRLIPWADYVNKHCGPGPRADGYRLLQTAATLPGKQDAQMLAFLPAPPSKECKRAAAELKRINAECQQLQSGDGHLCSDNLLCRSGYCKPGPSVRPDQPGPKYCLNKALNCAKPKSAGGRYGETMAFAGPPAATLTCVNPAQYGWGSRPAQFMLAKRPVINVPPGKGPVESQPIAKKRSDGSPCKVALECGSGYCTPGPSPRPDQPGQRYCLNASKNCALPGAAGGMYGQNYVLNGQTLKCLNPAAHGWGRLPAQFMLPVKYPGG